MKNSNTYPVRSKEPWVGGSEGSPVPSGTSGERCPGVGSWCPWPSGWWTDPYTLGLCLFSPWPWWGAPNPTSGTLWSHPPPSDMSFSSSSSSSSGSLARTSHRAARSSPWSSTANLSTTISVCSSNHTGTTTNTREQDVVKPLLSGALWKLSAPHLKNDPLPPFSCQSTPLRSLCPPPLSIPLPHLNSLLNWPPNNPRKCLPQPTSSLLPVERPWSLEQWGPSALRLYMLGGAGHTHLTVWERKQSISLGWSPEALHSYHLMLLLSPLDTKKLRKGMLKLNTSVLQEDKRILFLYIRPWKKLLSLRGNSSISFPYYYVFLIFSGK